LCDVSINRMKKEDLYDISSYSEDELYEILDLANPTDRELEAKILMMIHKYEKMNTRAGKRLSNFFESIYTFFFDDEDAGEEEADEEENKGLEGLTTMADAEKVYKTKNDKDAKITKIDESNKTTGTMVGDLMKIDDENKTGGSNVIYTKNVEYAQGALNPILKQTTKRIISIDSQYRSDKTTMSTEFTFNLSEPLKDVVSLKLYSIQIPYTWYTIGKSYGSNFFYFKGRVAGITEETHDIQIQIESGNYKPQELIDTVNTAIQTKDSTIDANISDSLLNYNKFTSLTTFNAIIKKQYNESSFYVNFPRWESPYQADLSRNTTIPSYLGFQSTIYYGNSLKSPLYHSMENTALTSDSNRKFTINSTNNYFTVYQYSGTFPYDAAESVVDVSTTVRFSLVDGTYTRKELITDLNAQITSNTNLYDSYVARTNIDTSNNEYDTVVSFIDLRIKFSRTFANTNISSKTVIVFPDSSDIWIGESSCFRFDVSYNEMDLIYSDLSPIAQTDRYIISGNPSVELKCIVPEFVNTINDISFNIEDSTGEGYTLTEYLSAINTGILVYDTSYNDIYGHTILNAPAVDYAFDSEAADYPIGTYAYLKDNIFHLYLNISRVFDESMYEIDIANSIFVNTIALKDTGGVALTGTTLTDLTINYTATMNAGGINVTAGDKLCTINPKLGGNNGNEGDVSYELTFPSTASFSNYPTYQEAINEIFSDYIDPISGLHIFAGTKLTSSVSNNVYNVIFTVTIAKTLIAKNYSIEFIDDTNNTWKNNVFIDTTMTEDTYDLSYNIPATDATKVYNADDKQLLEITTAGDIAITGVDTIAISNTLTIETGINDTIVFKGYEDGVSSTGGENDVTIVVPSGIYSTDYLIETINIQIAGLTTITNAKSTVFSLEERSNGNNYVKIVMNVTRTYDAQDYNIVFYDRISFSKCFVGIKSIQNTTWDTTVGWIMGFRNYTSYDLSAFYDTTAGKVIVVGDTGVSTNLFNYFLLCLDDFNQNHLNDGLVTVTGSDTSIPLPSYAKRSEFQCDPVSGELVYNNTTGLTEKQIYAVNEIANSVGNATSIGSSVSAKSYGTGPYVTDVFGLIPVKTNGLINGAPYVEFGGTLQNQERSYFGPVNIHRMGVKMVTDRGNNVDLNNANWSFSLICEQLNKLEPNGK
jgi:hypothetical protein